MRAKYFIFCLLFVATGWSQELPSYIIKDVVIEGTQRASEQVITSTSQFYPGRSITALDVQRGIRRLWNLGFFADIQVYMDEETEDGVVLRLELVEYPSLENIVLEGNKKIGKKKILEAIEIKSPQIISEFANAEAIRKIKKLYHEDGYLNVEVTTRLEPGTRDFGRVLYIDIVEHKKVRLRRIRFEGNEHYSAFRLRRQMKNTKLWRWYTFWRSPFNRDKFEEDLASIVSYYQNRGYRDARVVTDTVITTPNRKGLELLIQIQEGNIYYYRNFTWEGNTLHSDQKLAAALGYEKGDRYHKEGFELAVAQRVHPIYMDEGYLYSRVEPVEYPVGKDSLDVIFNVAENHKVAIRYINVSGNEKTRDYVVRRELRINPGETFSYAKLNRSQRDVWILNYFDNVEPQVLPVDEDEVDLAFEVQERSTDRANLSVGYTEQFGMIGGGGLEFNNLLGTGQKLVLNYNRGSRYGIAGFRTQNQAAYQSASINLINPWVLNTPNLVGASAFYSNRGRTGASYYLPFDIVTKGGSVRWGRRFRWPDSYFRGSWIFQGSDSRYYGDMDNLYGYLIGIRPEDIRRSSEGETYVSTIGIALTQSIVRDSRDRPEFPTMGSELTWTTTISGIILGGNEDFHKHVFDLTWYMPTLSPKLVFLQGVKLGITKTVKDETDRSILPPDEKFYLGGTGIPYGEMLRGYKDNSIGPFSASAGRPLGGTILFKYSAELRLSLSESPTIYTLAFLDMGNLWSGFEQADPFNLKRSVGGGVRMFMPMLGMLGLDAGYGFDEVLGDDDGPGWEVHFIFGQQF